MKSVWKSSETYFNLASVIVGAVAASGSFLPSPIVQVAGLLAMVLAAVAHTAARTALKVQDATIKGDAAAEIAKVSSITPVQP